MLRNGGGRGLLELNIARLAAADASNYSCSAVNDVGHSQRTAVVSVHCKPRLSRHLCSISIELTTVPCTVLIVGSVKL